ncbi:hypothetical protein [Labrys neptuniae]
MLAGHKCLSRRHRACLPYAFLAIIGCGLLLAACAAGSGFDRRPAYREAAARCAGARDAAAFACERAQSQRIIDEGYAAICRGRGIADNSPAMKRCKGELGYADCVRSISDYQGYAATMNPRARWEPSASTVCKNQQGAS